MFDSILCDLELPYSGKLDSKNFQTKDLGCLDQEYRIDIFGQLYKVGSQPNYIEFFPHTGLVNICIINDGYYLEYEIEFEDGKYGKIDLVEKRNLKKSIAELKKLQSDWANGYIENQGVI